MSSTTEWLSGLGGVGEAISGVSSLLSAFGIGDTSAKQQERAYNYNSQLMAQQQGYNESNTRQSWKYQKDLLQQEQNYAVQNAETEYGYAQQFYDKYMTADAQRQALIKAGYNPNALFETGATGQTAPSPASVDTPSAPGVNAASVGSSGVGTGSPSAVNYLQGAASAFEGLSRIAVNRANVQSTEADTMKTYSEMLNAQYDQALSQAQTDFYNALTEGQNIKNEVDKDTYRDLTEATIAHVQELAQSYANQNLKFDEVGLIGAWQDIYEQGVRIEGMEQENQLKIKENQTYFRLVDAQIGLMFAEAALANSEAFDAVQSGLEHYQNWTEKEFENTNYQAVASIIFGEDSEEQQKFIQGVSDLWDLSPEETKVRLMGNVLNRDFSFMKELNDHDPDLATSGYYNAIRSIGATWDKVVSPIVRDAGFIMIGKAAASGRLLGKSTVGSNAANASTTTYKYSAKEGWKPTSRIVTSRQGRSRSRVGVTRRSSKKK